MNSVLDEKHGIETIKLDRYYYLPYYWKNGAFYYYKGHNPLRGYKRATFTSYHDAYNFVARSRRMPVLPYPQKQMFASH